MVTFDLGRLWDRKRMSSLASELKVTSFNAKFNFEPKKLHALPPQTSVAIFTNKVVGEIDTIYSTD